jgi:hypothetical protein
MATNANDYNDYYIATDNGNNLYRKLLVLNKSVMDGLLDGCDFKKYLYNLEKNELCIEETAFILTNGSTSTKGYKMPDGWKHELIDNIVTETSIDDIDKYIGQLGIRKAFNLYEDMGIGDEPPNLATDDGLMSMFYGVLDQIFDIGEGVEQIDKEEYDNQDWTWNQSNQPEYDDPEEEEEEEDEEETEAFEEAIANTGIVAKAA